MEVISLRKKIYIRIENDVKSVQECYKIHSTRLFNNYTFVINYRDKPTIRLVSTGINIVSNPHVEKQITKTHSTMESNKKPTSDIQVINTIEGIKSLVDGIAILNASHRSSLPLLYIDIEQMSLGEDGELNILTILLCYGPDLRRRFYLVDISILANMAFSTRGFYGASLRSILDSPSYQKVFFDVRHDSHILYVQYGIKLERVHDLQLMESACRPNESERECLQLFETLIHKMVRGPARQRWFVDKFNGEWLYKRTPGGSHRVFQKRPIPPYIQLYCCRNIQFMPELYSKICRSTPRFMDLVAKESQNRVEETQKEEHNPFACGRFRNPWTAEQNKKLDSWAEENPDFVEFRLVGGILW
jgi:exonuclease 3'-5' domain-containing protein 1